MLTLDALKLILDFSTTIKNNFIKIMIIKNHYFIAAPSINLFEEADRCFIEQFKPSHNFIYLIRPDWYLAKVWRFFDSGSVILTLSHLYSLRCIQYE